MPVKQGALYRSALGTGATCAGLAWAMLKFCGLWNPAMGVTEYGASDYDAFYSRLDDSTFHRALFAGPAVFREPLKGGPSRSGAVTLQPLSVLSDAQYEMLLRSSPCRDVVATTGGLPVPAIAIAVGRNLGLLRKFTGLFLRGMHVNDVQRMFASPSTVEVLEGYDPKDEVAQLNKVRHILRIGFGTEALASMLVLPEHAASTTWDSSSVPTHVIGLVWILTRCLRDVLHPGCDASGEHLDETVPKILLPLATFCMKWSQVRTTSTSADSVRYSDLPHGYGLGNEYDCEAVDAREGRVLSQDACKKWTCLVKEHKPTLDAMRNDWIRDRAAMKGKGEAETEILAREPKPVVDVEETKKRKYEDMLAGVAGVSECRGDVRQSPCEVSFEEVPGEIDPTADSIPPDARHQNTPEAKARVGAEAKARAGEQVEARAVDDPKARAEAEAKARAEARAQTEAEAEAKARAEAEAKARAGEQVKARPLDDQIARYAAISKARAEARAQREAEAAAKARAEAEAKARADAAAETRQKAITAWNETHKGWNAHLQWKVKKELVPDAHRTCHLGNSWSPAAVYVSFACFVCKVLQHEWNVYERFQQAEGKERPLSPSELGRGHEYTRHMAEHFASLTWADASQEVWLNLKAVGDANKGFDVDGAGGKMVLRLYERAVFVDSKMCSAVCAHCTDSGAQFVQLQVDVGSGFVRMLDFERLQASEVTDAPPTDLHKDTPGKLSERTVRPGMFLVVFTKEDATLMDLAYVSDVTGFGYHRTASLVLLYKAFQGLQGRMREETLHYEIVYDAEATARMLGAFALGVMRTDSSRIKLVTALPAAPVLYSFCSRMDPVVECFCNPLVYFDLRAKARRPDIPPPSFLGPWEDRTPPREHPRAAVTDRSDPRMRRVETVDKLMDFVRTTMKPNPSQLRVLNDQKYSHVDVREGVTTPRRRVSFVMGGGGVGKSSLLRPLISINLANNWNTGGHAFTGLKFKGNNGGDAVVGVFAVMNRTLDSCVRALLHDGALVTAEGKDSRAKILRIGRGTEDPIVKTVTIDHLGGARLGDLHHAWQDPGPNACSLERKRFAEFVARRKVYQEAVARCGAVHSKKKARFELHKARQHLYAHLLSYADVVASTVGTAATELLSEGMFSRRFSSIYVDECGKAGIHEVFFLGNSRLGTGNARNLVLFGDHKQMLPFSKTQERVPSAYRQTSLFEIVAATPQMGVFTLDTQYRMHPAIAKYISRAFYDGRLIDGLPPQYFHRPYHEDRHGRFPPVLFLDTRDDSAFAEMSDRYVYPTAGNDGVRTAPSELVPEGKSYRNQGEAEMACAVALSLATEYGQVRTYRGDPAGGAHRRQRIVIVSPYATQVRVIEDMVKKDCRLCRHRQWDVDVLTAERVQGEEADVVIVSTVRSQWSWQRRRVFGEMETHYAPASVTQKRASFASLPNRAAVMLTRARYSVIVLGDSTLLSSAEGLPLFHRGESVETMVSPWKSFIQYCDEHGWLTKARLPS